MLTITIFAAGLVCLAGVFGLRLGRAQAATVTPSARPTPTTADERGITLQTLIVTAVLVLMAVAAGVVIVAITNNAAEDLEQANPNIESRCNEVEVYDPTVAALGIKGSNGGEDGSAIGCVPVCVVTVSATVDSGEVDESDDFEFNRDAELRDDADTAGIDLFQDATTLHIEGDVASTLGDGNKVRVNAAENDCILVNASGDLID